MKLRNKKTGEIRDCQIMADGFITIKSLKDLEEWEDVPNDHWLIDIFGEVMNGADEYCSQTVSEMKEIGNYFETEEEAEKAVEKLKAWKRLRDSGFRFNGWEDSVESGNNFICFRLPSENWETDVCDDLDLLFGGEDE